MRKQLLFSCLLAVIIQSSAGAQAPAPVKPAPTPPATSPTQPPPKTPPSTAAPTPRRTTTSTAGRGGLAITATTPKGATLAGVHVELIGATDRDGETDANGQINFPGLLAGTYRLRFSGDHVTTFEREVTVRGTSIADVDVMLNPAPEPRVVQAPAPVRPPEPVTPPVGPKGQPVTMGIVEFLEKEFVGRQPRRESLLSCSGSERATMIQLNEPLPERVYESADAVYYVLGGEGNIQVNGKETRLGTNGFASVPRGTTHSFSRRGSRSLVLLAVLSGEPCEEAR